MFIVNIAPNQSLTQLTSSLCVQQLDPCTALPCLCVPALRGFPGPRCSQEGGRCCQRHQGPLCSSPCRHSGWYSDIWCGVRCTRLTGQQGSMERLPTACSCQERPFLCCMGVIGSSWPISDAAVQRQHRTFCCALDQCVPRLRWWTSIDVFMNRDMTH